MKTLILHALLNLLFPVKCPFCGICLEPGDLLCGECQQTLPWLTGPSSVRKVEQTEGCVSVLRYEGKVPQAIRGYKFHDKPARSRAFGTLAAQAVSDYWLTERGAHLDFITWPSLSPSRLRQRGYDQAERLAKEVGRILGLPVVRVFRKRERPAQSGLGLADRRRNLREAYRVICPELCAGKHILLLDDVVTSGSTLRECAGVLRRSGAAAVCCATLAQAGNGHI